jgi:hypothetical protein
VATGQASAVTVDERPDGQIVDGSPEAVVVVGRTGEVGSWAGTPRGGARWTCGYYGFDADPNGFGTDGTVRYDDGPVDPEPGELYVLVCRDPSGRTVKSLLRRFDPADPLGGIAATERALDEARRRLDLPLPDPGLNPPGEQLVGVATWLWVDGPWTPASATAQVAGVSATVTATPVSVVWSPGDGTTVTCDGPGTPYDPTRSPADQRSSCTHAYGRSSAALPGGAYALTATVTYEVTWSSSTGAGGSLGSLTRATTVPVVVEEAQALIR